ncbi:MAG: peptide ABC transporter substrate-binding protein [Bdellovibrionales bacterium]|nr:peptide ABC transporter substrate-binding protein [Bdellovibrionales bacterium]
MIHRFLVPFLVLALSGCTRGSDENRGFFSLHLNSEPVTLDPSRVEDGLGIRVLVNLMDGLMGFNSRGELVKRLASTIEISPDLKLYKCVIRDDAVWSDGKPVEADQIQLAIERALKPETGAKLAGLLKWIEGAETFAAGKAGAVTGIHASGKTIEFHLTKPISFFDQILALPITYPLRKDVLAANEGKWDPLRGKNVPTNGAYRIRSSVPDQEILLEAARPLPSAAPTKVLLRVITDESTASTLFDQGKLDVLTRIPAFDQKRYEEKKVVRSVPFQATYFLGFNLKKKPFDRVEFRRALAGAVKKGELVRMLGTGEEPAASWIPKGYEGFYPFKADSEGRDVEFAGSKVASREEIRIAFDSGTRNAIAMEKVQADLKEGLGWKVRLKNMDWKTLVYSIGHDPEMVYRYGWSSSMKDPAGFLLAFVTKDPFNFSGFSNARYDALVEEIAGMKPSPEREKKIFEAEKILLNEQAVVVPLYHYVTTFAVGPRVKRYDVSPLVGVTLFEEVELK